MFKGYKAFVKNQGSFEPPGARALQDFKNLYDSQLEVARVQAVRAAEIAVAQEKMHEKKTQMRRPYGGAWKPCYVFACSPRRCFRGRIRVSTLAFLFCVPDESTPAPSASPIREPGSTICSICSQICDIRPNPWQRTRTHIAVSKVVVIERPTPVRYGIALEPCNHIFCGACLAQAIYHSMNMAFDPKSYGTKLPSYESDVPGLGRDPVPCPTCQSEKRAKPVYISDSTARLVLGEPNMDEWNQARFLRTINLIFCPHKGCREAFDVDDVVPAGVLFAPSCVQCPRCKGWLCKNCKSVWHENLTCLMYQASPIQERFPSNRPTDAPWPWEQQQLVAT
ncbi:hypothetical protein FB45DRAFT_908166 [Roridomyces roridus]|uniref:RBR-type E3 ubiquitin transferase n=1 Tax=Roridomyces roridus TaxID=1738132 RepID=A0AAD7C2C1_9AGAR|nr:hypothetical protein FB45DRAFT_908166 [Roridomyces roridus]